MTDARTLPEVIHGHGLAAPGREAFRFVTDRHTVREQLSYAQLLAEAQALAAGLAGVEPGARVPLVFAPGLPFVVALLACWLARVIPVPLAPEGFRRDAPGRRRLLQEIEAHCGLCDESFAFEMDQPIRWVRAAAPGRAARLTTAPVPTLDPDGIALLQFTSGSTAAPRGVAITHANLMANMRMIRHAFGHADDATVVGWAPLYHDQGLIGNVLQPLYLGSRCVLFAPQTFVRDPLLWLELISDHRAHTSGGPNFAYDLCVARYNAARLAGLDLGSWQIAFNGAEPVHAQTVARFAECFAPHGFDRRSIYPCYGLAEATLFASGGPGRRIPVARSAQARAGAAEPARMGCGQAAEGTRIRIVDETGMGCAPFEIGEIWISGAHVSPGYWRGASAETFRARLDGELYLRTGDLGFLDEAGELFPAGRIKELIIQHGRNFAPHDIEHTVAAASAALDPYRGVVFSTEVEGREQAIAVHEIARHARRTAAPDDIVRAVRKHVAAVHDLTLQQVLLVEPLSIPLTTSGKKQRARVRAEFLAGTLSIVNHAALA